MPSVGRDRAGSSADEPAPAAKRPRSTTRSENNDDDVDGPSLPPEVWAGVMEYLPFDALLSCAATSRVMLHDAMPFLTKLHIDKSSQINLTVASRFRDIREIRINSLLTAEVIDEGTQDELTTVRPDFETKIRVVPFLSRFASLERVIFGGKDEGDGSIIENFAPAVEYFWEGEEGYPNEGPRDSMKAFLDLVSGAFRCGALPKQLNISGLCCPDSAPDSDLRHDGCETCVMACRSFPLESVARFESRGSSVSNAMSGRMYGLDVCLERARIESIIESRPGGHDLLRSEERLLRLLGNGRKYKIAPNNAKALHIVKYKREQLDEIERSIRYAEIDVKKLATEKVSNAILSSFSRDGNATTILPRNQRYLATVSLESLRDDVGLPIDEEVFETLPMDLLQHAESLVWVLSQSHAIRQDNESFRIDQYADVELDCLKLIRQLLELETNPPIEAAIDVIPCLVYWLKTWSTGYKHRKEAAGALDIILARGTKEHMNAAVGSGAIYGLSLMLANVAASTAEAKVAASMLSNIIACDDNIEAIASSASPRKLIRLLASKDVACVKASLRILSIIVKDHISHLDPEGVYAYWMASMMRNILRIIKQPDQAHLLVDCSVLLRRTLASRPNRRAEVIDDRVVVARLVELVKTAKSNDVRVNFSHVLIMLVGVTGSQTEILVKETSLVSALVGLADSSDDDIANKAIAAVGGIAKTTPEYRNLALQSGIMQPLMRLLENSDSSLSTLQIASQVYARCCSGTGVDSRAGLVVLTPLLVKRDGVILRNTCWALFYLLDGLSRKEISDVIDIGFVNPLLDLLGGNLFRVQKPVLRSLFLVTTAGHKGIQAIAESNNGIARITNERTRVNVSMWSEYHRLVCNIVSNIIADNQNQAEIDKHAVPALVNILSSSEQESKRHALWAIYQLTKSANVSQIKSLVNQDCLDHLCDMTGDCNTATIALWALKNIFRVRKEESTNKLKSSSNIRMVESKLEEWANETQQLEQQTRCVELLKKKKAWLEADAQDERVKSLTMATDLLKKQQLEVEKHLQSFRENIASVEAETLGQTYTKLHKRTLDDQLKSAMNKLSKAKKELSDLLTEAENIAPDKEWRARLASDDLPSDLQAVNTALDTSLSKVNSLEAGRDSKQRIADIGAVKAVLNRLFKSTNAERTKKRVSSEVKDKDEVSAPKKRKKKSVQAVLSSFCPDHTPSSK